MEVKSQSKNFFCCLTCLIFIIIGLCLIIAAFFILRKPYVNQGILFSEESFKSFSQKVEKIISAKKGFEVEFGQEEVTSFLDKFSEKNLKNLVISPQVRFSENKVIISGILNTDSKRIPFLVEFSLGLSNSKISLNFKKTRIGMFYIPGILFNIFAKKTLEKKIDNVLKPLEEKIKIQLLQVLDKKVLIRGSK